MLQINNLLKFYTAPPADGAKGCHGALCHAATLVDESARKRYGYRFPVYISDLAYGRCVAYKSKVVDKEDGIRLETLRLFKVLARVKYVISNAEKGSTMANMSITLNERKEAADVVDLTVMLILLEQAAPALLIKLAGEKYEENLESLMSDWATGVSTIKEAV